MEKNDSYTNGPRGTILWSLSERKVETCEPAYQMHAIAMSFLQTNFWKMPIFRQFCEDELRWEPI